MKRGIKHGHLPGDIPKADKIKLLEMNLSKADMPRSERAGIKAYRKRILEKERAVLKERFQRAAMLERQEDEVIDVICAICGHFFSYVDVDGHPLCNGYPHHRLEESEAISPSQPVSSPK